MKSKFFRRFIVILSIIALIGGCGSSGGMNEGDGGDGGDGEPSTPTEPTFNFTGTLYNANGYPFPAVDIYVFSDWSKQTTDTDGSYAMNVSNEMHTLMGSRLGYVERFRLIDTSNGADVDTDMVLHASAVASKTILANTGDTSIVSNVYRNHTAILNIPAQSSGKFWHADVEVDSVAISFENINLNGPIPVPLPSASNTDIPLPGGKQTPSVLIAVQPALFKMDTSGTLTFPNPDSLSMDKILRFDPETHQWKTITEISSASIAINRGGVYGLFFDTPKNGSIRGQADPGSLIRIGDETVLVGNDGTFFINEVPVPPEGNVAILALGPPDEETGIRPVIQNDVEVKENQQTLVDLVPVTVGTLTITSSTDTLVCDGQTEVLITAEVLDSDGKPLTGEVTVDFTTTSGELSQNSVRTSGGIANATLMCTGGENGVARVTASSGGVSDTVSINLLSVPKSISLSVSQISVKSDNSDSAIITATVLNSQNAPFADIDVTFSVDSGMISYVDDTGDDDTQVKTTIQTDVNGKAQIKFSAGPGTDGKTNRTAAISAAVSGLAPVLVPIQVTGTAVELDTDKTNLDIQGETTATLTVTVKDYGLNPIFSAPVQFSVEPEGALSWAAAEEKYAEFKTDLTGKVVVTITGEAVAEEAVLKVSSLGDQKSLTYKVSSPDLLFSIISPEEDPASVSTNTELPVTVQAPFQDRVRFSTSFGEWENGEKVIDVDVVNKNATATIRSALAGIASVQVFDLDDPGTSDSLRVAIAAPSSEADNISLQTNTGVVAPSTGDTQNTVTLRATVKNANGQVVRNSPVLFSLSNTTGGGEYISPVIVYTNAQGIATSTFYAGSLTSSAEGVLVKAEVVGMSNVTPSTRPIIIGGTAGSVVISVSTVVTTDENDTTYTLPGTVMVADANGNPVSGAQVTLGTWPISYFTGIWTVAESECVPFYYDIDVQNEDINRNLIMDPDEDANGDGELTPPNSAAGVIRVYEWEDADGNTTDTDGTAIGTTNETGTVKFELTYPKTSAAWIRDELTAKVLVAGTETQSTYDFVLMPSTADTGPPCSLQDSPYNRSTPDGSINLLTDKDTLSANGQSQATVSAVIYDFNGLPGPSGVTVTFKIISGSGGFPQETIVSASTSSSGKASVAYTAPKGVTGVVTIEATAEGYGTVQKGLITLDQGEILIISSGADGMLFDGAGNPGVPVMVADGLSVLNLRAQMTNSDGSQWLTETAEKVDWKLTSIATGIDDIGGIGVVGSLSTTGNLELSTFTFTGDTSIEYTAGLISSEQDPVEVTVTATINSTGATDDITIILERDKVAEIALALDPVNQEPAGGIPVTIRATVTNQNNESVDPGEKITFTTDLGNFLISGAQEKEVTLETRNASGIILLQLLVTEEEIEGDNTATVKARSLSGSAEGVLNLTFSVTPAEPEPYRIEVHPDYPKPAIIDVLGGPTGRTQSEIRFLVYDEAGDLVTGRHTINFAIDDNRPNGGEDLSSTTGQTIGNGEVFTILKSGLRPGVVYVKATYTKEDGTTIESVENAVVQIQGGMPAAEYFRLIDGIWADGEREFTASVRDIFGDPVPDNLAVKFDTTNGFVNPSQDLTSQGTVETVLFASASATEYTVTAETDGAFTTKVSDIAVLYRNSAPSTPIIYAGTTGGGIYKSTDSGSNWNNISGLSTGSATDSQKKIDPYINDVAVDPDNISLIFAGGGYVGKGKIDPDSNNLFISRDGGTSWVNDATGIPTGGNIPVTSVHCEAGGPYVWVGTQGDGIYVSTDEGKTFTSAGPIPLMNTLVVNEFIHVTGSGGNALLYAATDTGVYKSTDGGYTWSISGIITDVVKTVGFYRKSGSEANSIIYAGTEESGVYFSDSAGENWKPMPETGRLLVVGDPKPGEDNEGTGEFAAVDYNNDGQDEYINVLSGAKTETWTVICKQAASGGGVFRVIGSNSGEQPDYDITDGKYDKLPGIIEFTINAGGTDFIVGDYFTFDIVKDDAKTVTSLLVDEGNNRLYAVTLLESFIQDNSYYHDIGSVYYFKLGPNGSVEPGNWTLAIDGLPQFDASSSTSDDDTIVPQYALAPIPGVDGNMGTPKALMIGGEKVTVYKAASGLTSGTPIWQPSMNGIQNRIMTRLIVGGDSTAP